MNDSILETVKENLLSYDTDSTDFDNDIIMHINALFLELNQIGAGPEDGFVVEDNTTLWSEYITPGLSNNQNNLILGSIKEYIILSCKMTFDPPESSNVSNSMKSIIDKHLNRIMMQIDYKQNGG